MKDDAKDARAAKEEAIKRVARNANPAWMAAALDTVRFCAYKFPDFTTDNVWEQLIQRGVRGPHERRALGPVMKTAMHEQIIRPLDEFRPSTSSVNHARLKRVWTKWS